MFETRTSSIFSFLGSNLISLMDQGNSKLITYLCNNNYVLLIYYQLFTMDSTHTPDSEYLFALCITDGLLDEMDERERASTLSSITQTLRRINPTTATSKHPQKYQNNEPCQNNGKVSI